jgi:adiponectin receptor
MESEEGAALCGHQESAAAAAAVKGGGGGGKRRRKGQRRGGEGGERKKYKLVSYHELPDYMKENEFILNYYRSEWPILNAVLSLFSWHNETINIWTHLLGFMLFFGLTLVHLGQYFPQVADLIGNLSW